MSIITESLIHRMKEDMAAAIATEGQIVYGNDITLQAVFDLALVGLNVPDDSAVLVDLRAAAAELKTWTPAHLAAHAVVTSNAMNEAKTPAQARKAGINALAVMLVALERQDAAEASQEDSAKPTA